MPRSPSIKNNIQHKRSLFANCKEIRKDSVVTEGGEGLDNKPPSERPSDLEERGARKGGGGERERGRLGKKI